MSQIDPATLDYSAEMKNFFGTVSEVLVNRFEKSPAEARDLINVYFQLDVDPLERALLMHSDAESVAADLASMANEGSALGEATSADTPGAPSRSSAGW